VDGRLNVKSCYPIAFKGVHCRKDERDVGVHTNLARDHLIYQINGSAFLPGSTGHHLRENSSGDRAGREGKGGASALSPVYQLNTPQHRSTKDGFLFRGHRSFRLPPPRPFVTQRVWEAGAFDTLRYEHNLKILDGLRVLTRPTAPSSGTPQQRQ